ncbi:MAG: AAA family ATPase [Acidobacteriales bacterium]|nr:AAA family ATPase [Candidatus Koribacter versatilis]MBI3646771.1 AAA family ATPase [Terriglobales bacterium]
MTMDSENRLMHGIAVAVLTEDREQSVVLNTRVESTHMARTVLSHVGFPMGPSDAVLRQVLDQRAEIVLVDIDPQNPQRAIRAIEMIHAAAGDVTIFAVGEMTQPTIIVSAMRAGAREFLDRGASRESMIEAFTRFTASLSRAQRSAGKARVFTFLNAKGGVGATTTAVNTAVALEQSHGRVVLVDFAPIGHAALQLNLRPQFTVIDALQNLHRMDVSLLDGLMTHYRSGLHLLAGAQQPHSVAPTASELARLFDLLVSQYNFVVVDCSGRLDATMQMVCDLSNAVLMVAQTDVVSLWSAGRIQTFLQEGAGRDRLRIVLNRYKKIPGFTEEDVEKATNCKVLWKIPNNFQVVGPAIDKGSPVALQEGHEVGRSYQGLAAELAGATTAADGALSLVYQHDKAEDKKRPAGRLIVSPVRAGQ